MRAYFFMQRNHSQHSYDHYSYLQIEEASQAQAIQLMVFNIQNHLFLTNKLTLAQQFFISRNIRLKQGRSINGLD